MPLSETKLHALEQFWTPRAATEPYRGALEVLADLRTARALLDRFRYQFWLDKSDNDMPQLWREVYAFLDADRPPTSG